MVREGRAWRKTDNSRRKLISKHLVCVRTVLGLSGLSFHSVLTGNGPYYIPTFQLAKMEDQRCKERTEVIRVVARWPGPASHMGRGLPHWSCTKGHLSPSNSWRNPLQQLRRAPEHSIHACHRSEPSGSVSLLPICSWDQAACALALCVSVTGDSQG